MVVDGKEGLPYQSYLENSYVPIFIGFPVTSKTGDHFYRTAYGYFGA